MMTIMADPSSIANPRDGVILAIFTPMAAMILYLMRQTISHTQRVYKQAYVRLNC